MKKCVLLIVMVLSFGGSAMAQHADGLYNINRRYEDDPFDELTYFYAGANYLSNNVYMGRKDSARLPYVSPYIGYQVALGFYVRGAVAYAATGNTGHFDQLALEGGYDRTFGYHVLVGASYEYDKYQRNSPSITASITGKTNIYCLYRNATFEPQLSFTSLSGKSSDMAIGASVAHNLRFLSNTLNIFPMLTVYAGSDNFYNDYYNTRLIKTDQLTAPAVVVKDAGNLRLLAAEVAVKAVYRVNEWLFTLKPTMAIPMSGQKLYLPTGIANEKLRNTLYVELDICHRHERK